MRYVAPPSQNRTWSVTPSGSQRESFTTLNAVKWVNCVFMHIVRSVSGHVCSTHCLTPAPLRSLRITRVHHYYGYLRLPVTLHPAPRCLDLSRAAQFSAPVTAPPWLPHTRSTSSTGSVIPGGHDVLAKSHAALLPAGYLETIGPLQCGHFGT